MDIIEIGEIVNTHGVRGELKLNPWTDDLEKLLETKQFFYKLNGKIETLCVVQIRLHKNCAIIKAEGIDDMQTAEGFRGQTLYVEKEELPEGIYYIADLLGLKVITEEGELGNITDVFSTGANDVYEVSEKGKKPIYLPALSHVIDEINLTEKYMRVKVPEGLLD